jgi:hypothetical protein
MHYILLAKTGLDNDCGDFSTNPSSHPDHCVAAMYCPGVNVMIAICRYIFIVFDQISAEKLEILFREISMIFLVPK